MITIIYPYRERDLDRIRFSLNSLNLQTDKNFNVKFVDYGSSIEHSKLIKETIKTYSFVDYKYYYTQYQPWNKSKALNSVIKNLETSHFFVADIDMIFHPEFIANVNQLSKTNDVWYYQVGFLDKSTSKVEKSFSEYTVKFKSNKEATGLTLCPTEYAKNIRGFDEIYHFWGSEDTDFHERLKNKGYDVKFYSEKLLLLHKWHKTYRNKEKKYLTKKLQVNGIVQFNKNQLDFAKVNKRVIVNDVNWGRIMSHEEFVDLQKADNYIEYNNYLSTINHFLYQQLTNIKPGTYHFKFKLIDNKDYLKYLYNLIFKRKKKMPKLLSLKAVNDKLLFHIINFYHNKNYCFKVSDDKTFIFLSIKI
ncbi:glycosyltransferase family 2 protein [Mesoflavibacter sp. CH_XMU1422-2]|uniref:glycosyltransferase family 2 protein n=1 Tax=Mesoflavibacter sp. CH_XMU1422-2 TaxID=3107770 RepID=UPI0030084C12